MSHDEAEAVMRAAGLEPLDPYPGVGRGWRCRCMTCGNICVPRFDSIRSGQGGCRSCGNKATREAQRRPEAEAVERMRALGLEPLDPYPGSNRPWRCRCMRCSNIVTPTFGNSNKRDSRCRYCADYGLDWSGPALVYLLHHEALGAHKVGVAKQGGGRTQKFARAGWAVFRTAPFATGDDAFRVEQTVLAPYRDAGLCPYLSRHELPDGFTETVDAEAVSLLDLWAEIVAAAATTSR